MQDVAAGERRWDADRDRHVRAPQEVDDDLLAARLRLSGQAHEPAAIGLLGSASPRGATTRGDGGTREAAALYLQTTAGNRAVGGAVQRARDAEDGTSEGKDGCCAGSSAPCRRCSGHTIEVADAGPAAVMRKAAGGATQAPAVAVGRLSGAAHPLESGTRSRMESAFGHDFSGVRVHTDGDAAASATRLDARAYTLGSNVAFAAGEYQPGTVMGDALIAHELAHVVQQQGQERRAGEPVRVVDDPAAEADADVAAAEVVLSEARPSVQRVSGLGIHRCTPTVGGEMPASTFKFEKVTGSYETADDPSLPWYAACVNITVTYGPQPRFAFYQFEVGYPGIHARGRTHMGHAQAAAAEAFNTVIKGLLSSRRPVSPETVKTRVQARMRAAGIFGAKVNSPCVTKMLEVVDWPTRH
jgi:hypothetical protein